MTEHRFNLSKETTVGISIGLIISIITIAFIFGVQVQALRSDVNGLQEFKKVQESKINAIEQTNTDIRLDLIKIRTQLDTVIDKLP